MRAYMLMPAIAIIAMAAVQAQVPVVGPADVQLKELANTPTLVTVVLKGGAEDTNLRVTDVQEHLFTVLTEDNEHVPYLYESVEEVRVQGGEVLESRFELPAEAMLRAEDQKVIERAFSRTAEVYSTSKDNQDLRMDAAMVIALDGNEEALEYLRRLADSENLLTQLAASLKLYVAGEEVDENLIRRGLESGNRKARAKAAQLAGLTGYRDAIHLLNEMLQDRAEELSAPAARALARLGERECIPTLIDMLGSLSNRCAEAAKFGLETLGGSDIAEQLRVRVQQTEGLERFRIVRTLYALDAPMGRRLLKRVFNEQPTLKPEAALLLARESDWDATQYLRRRLGEREDPTVANLVYRARNAAALFEGGDPQAMAVMLELLRSDKPEVQNKVFELVAEFADRRLLSVVQPSIEAMDAEIAVNASIAAVSIAMRDFRERLLTVREG